MSITRHPLNSHPSSPLLNSLNLSDCDLIALASTTVHVATSPLIVPLPNSSSSKFRNNVLMTNRRSALSSPKSDVLLAEQKGRCNHRRWNGSLSASCIVEASERKEKFSPFNRCLRVEPELRNDSFSPCSTFLKKKIGSSLPSELPSRVDQLLERQSGSRNQSRKVFQREKIERDRQKQLPVSPADSLQHELEKPIEGSSLGCVDKQVEAAFIASKGRENERAKAKTLDRERRVVEFQTDTLGVSCFRRLVNKKTCKSQNKLFVIPTGSQFDELVRGRGLNKHLRTAWRKQRKQGRSIKKGERGA